MRSADPDSEIRKPGDHLHVYVDALSTAAVAAELSATVVGGRVQAVIEVDELAIGLEIYAYQERHYLLITSDPISARCHLVPGKLRRGIRQPSPLGLLLRKYIDGARLVTVQQPAWERILWLDFSGKEGDTRLIVETMGRLSNIILTVEGEILDSIKRIGPDQNRYRVIVPHKPYLPPPPQHKARPDEVTEAMLAGFLRQDADRPAWRALVDNIAGVSPLFAREIVARACDDPEAPAFDVAEQFMHKHFASLLANMQAGRWNPCVVPGDGEDGGYRAFAAYELTHLGPCQLVESISTAMSLYFSAPVGAEAYDAARAGVMGQIEAERERLARKVAALERESVGAAEIEQLRQKGELLLAYGPRLSAGQTTLRAQYDPEGPALVIDLDPSLSPVENAQRYFDRYEKAKRAAEDIPGLQARAQHELAYIEQLATDLDLAESWPEIEEVREALQESGYWHGQHTRGPRGGKPGIRRIKTNDGFTILVGRNAKQNHVLLSQHSARDDLWLHARGVPGSHVIIKRVGGAIPQHVIDQAAELAATYSAGRHDTLVEVDVTERRYVRLMKGGKPGMVTYKNEQTLKVAPRKKKD